MDFDIIRCLPARYEHEIRGFGGGINELRLRSGSPLSAVTRNGAQLLGGGPLTQQELESIFKRLCGGSPYAYEEELRRGYFTVGGGHRVGVCGSAVINDGRISALKDISSLSFRFAREIKGCADRLLSMLGGSVNGGLLLAGPPACGKTTLLRDLIRQLSDSGKSVCVIDERGELAAVCGGRRGNDLGSMTDVLDGYPKSIGFELALRCFSPKIIACDEIGDNEADAINACAECGATILATVHSTGALSQRTRLLLSGGAFRHIALFKQDAVGRIERIENVGIDTKYGGDIGGGGRVYDRLSGKPYAVAEG